jgi:hypothetical protein
MKRALLFLLLGPVLCVALMSAPPAIHSPQAFGPIFLNMAPIMLGLSFGLMTIVCLVDWLCAGTTWLRVCASAIAAFAVIIIFQYATGAVAPLVGFAGAIPAAICSWLLSREQNKMPEAG